MKARLASLAVVALIIAVPLAVLACAGLGIAVLVVRHENHQFADYCPKKLNDTFLPFDNGHEVKPYDKEAPAYAGAAPHSITLLPAGFPAPELPDDTRAELLSDVSLPSGWMTEPKTYAAGELPTQAQLVICTEVVSVGTQLESCGTYTGSGSSITPVVMTGRFKYEVREVKSAKLVGAFELSSGAFDAKKCPGITFTSQTGRYFVIPPTDAAFVAAIRPFVESVRR